jgi:hypothetical protein
MQHSNIVDVDRGWTQRITVLGRVVAGADDMMMQGRMIVLGVTVVQYDVVGLEENRR